MSYQPKPLVKRVAEQKLLRINPCGETGHLRWFTRVREAGDPDPVPLEQDQAQRIRVAPVKAESDQHGSVSQPAFYSGAALLRNELFGRRGRQRVPPADRTR